MSIGRRLESLESRLGRPSPISRAEVEAAELRLSGGVPIREQLGRGHIMRPKYPGREEDKALVERYYAQYATGRDVRAEFTKKINAIAERLAQRNEREQL